MKMFDKNANSFYTAKVVLFLQNIIAGLVFLYRIDG